MAGRGALIIRPVNAGLRKVSTCAHALMDDG